MFYSFPIALYILQEFRIEAARISSEKTAAADQEAEGVQGNARGLDIDWRRVALLAILAAIWCNMHTGFIYEILLLLIYSAAFLAENIKAKRSLTRASKTLLASLGASICATLINPYGPGLWAYLPHLFFAPINRFIIELQPIGADSFLDPSVVLSTLLPVFCFGAIAYRSVKLRIANSTGVAFPVRLSSALIALLALFACLSCRRLIVAASVMILIESANFLGGFEAVAVKVWPKFWQKWISLIPL